MSPPRQIQLLSVNLRESSTWKGSVHKQHHRDDFFHFPVQRMTRTCSDLESQILSYVYSSPSNRGTDRAAKFMLRSPTFTYLETFIFIFQNKAVKEILEFRAQGILVSKTLLGSRQLECTDLSFLFKLAQALLNLTMLDMTTPWSQKLLRDNSEASGEFGHQRKSKHRKKKPSSLWLTTKFRLYLHT